MIHADTACMLSILRGILEDFHYSIPKQLPFCPGIVSDTLFLSPRRAAEVAFSCEVHTVMQIDTSSFPIAMHRAQGNFPSVTMHAANEGWWLSLDAICPAVASWSEDAGLLINIETLPRMSQSTQQGKSLYYLLLVEFSSVLQSSGCRHRLKTPTHTMSLVHISSGPRQRISVSSTRTLRQF